MARGREREKERARRVSGGQRQHVDTATRGEPEPQAPAHVCFVRAARTDWSPCIRRGARYCDRRDDARINLDDKLKIAERVRGVEQSREAPEFPVEPDATLEAGTCQGHGAGTAVSVSRCVFPHAWMPGPSACDHRITAIVAPPCRRRGL